MAIAPVILTDQSRCRGHNSLFEGLLDNNPGVIGQGPGTQQVLKRRLDHRLMIRRVQKDQIKRLVVCLQAAQAFDNIPLNDAAARFKSAQGDIFAQHMDCLGGFVNKNRLLRPAAQGFDPQGTRAGKQIKDSGVHRL